MTVTVTPCKSKHDRYRVTNEQLVCGIGKKPIRVIIQVYCWTSYNTEVVAIEAAKIAAKHGWRKIAVCNDNYEAEYPNCYNLSQLTNTNKYYGHSIGFTFKESNHLVHDDAGNVTEYKDPEESSFFSGCDLDWD